MSKISSRQPENKTNPLASIGSPILIVAILLAFIVCALAPDLPKYRFVPARDSGVFLFIGEQILNGKIPYRDIWDHKPPAIHYINAFGLWLGQGSRWGNTLLELAWVLITATLGYRLTQQAFGTLPAVVGTIAWLSALSLIVEGGNFPEEYALLFQFGALYLCWRSPKPEGKWLQFLLGLLCAICFLLKPNLIGVATASILGLLLKPGQARPRPLVHRLIASATGIVVILSATGLWFALNNAFDKLIDAVIYYNLAYATASAEPASVIFSSESHLNTILAGVQELLPTLLPLTALAGWLAGLIHLQQHRKTELKISTLLIILVIAFPLELLLVSISGRVYKHYYLAWLPTFALLTSFLIYFLVSHLQKFSWAPRVVSCGLMLIILFNFRERFLNSLTLLRQPPTPDVATEGLIQFIQNNTREADTVLIWGAETSLNFLARRPSPTRFVYQYPLYTRGYQSAALVREFLGDLQTKKPKLIIDASAQNSDIPPLEAIAREKRWGHSTILPEMKEVYDYLMANYKMTQKLEKDGWLLYQRQ